MELYRRALAALGIEGPYILCAHSISGLESMIWAQRYPQEVEAIVGLDATPANFADELKSEELSMRRILRGKLLNLSGLSRFGKPQCLPQLTDEEKRVIRELCVRNNMNFDIVTELRNVQNACEDPSVAWAEKWRKVHQDYADASVDGRLIQLSCGHYVHDFEYEKIAGEIRLLVQRL